MRTFWQHCGNVKNDRIREFVDYDVYNSSAIAENAVISLNEADMVMLMLRDNDSAEYELSGTLYPGKTESVYSEKRKGCAFPLCVWGTGMEGEEQLCFRIFYGSLFDMGSTLVDEQQALRHRVRDAIIQRNRYWRRTVLSNDDLLLPAEQKGDKGGILPL